MKTAEQMWDEVATAHEFSQEGKVGFYLGAMQVMLEFARCGRERKVNVSDVEKLTKEISDYLDMFME